MSNPFAPSIITPDRRAWAGVAAASHGVTTTHNTTTTAAATSVNQLNVNTKSNDPDSLVRAIRDRLRVAQAANSAGGP